VLSIIQRPRREALMRGRASVSPYDGTGQSAQFETDTWFSFRSLGRAGSHSVTPEVSIGNRKRPAF